MSYTTAPTQPITGYLFIDDRIQQLTEQLPKYKAEQFSKLFSEVYNAGKTEGFGLANLQENTIDKN